MLAHRLATSRIALRYTAKWKYHRTERSCEKIQLLNICNLECASRALRPATKVERYFWGQCLGWWKGNSSGLSRAELITLPWLPEPQATNGLPWHWKTTQEKAVFLLLLRTQLIKCELSGDSMPFSSPQIPSVSRELSIVTWWEQCWDLLLQQQLLQNCPKVLNPHVYSLVSVVKVILLLSGHQTWVSNEESQLWPSSHQLEKWDLKGPLEIGKNVRQQWQSRMGGKKYTLTIGITISLAPLPGRILIKLCKACFSVAAFCAWVLPGRGNLDNAPLGQIDSWRSRRYCTQRWGHVRLATWTSSHLW